MTAELPEFLEFLPLDEAAQRSGINIPVLENLIKEGRVRAIRIGGKLAVAEQDILALQIPAPSEEMRGRPIKAKDAIEKYKIASHSTLSGWRRRGIVRVIKRGHRNVWYDEYSVALAAQLYHSKQTRQGIRYAR